jgi:hypothetical protein
VFSVDLPVSSLHCCVCRTLLISAEGPTRPRRRTKKNFAKILSGRFLKSRCLSCGHDIYIWHHRRESLSSSALVLLAAVGLLFVFLFRPPQFLLPNFSRDSLLDISLAPLLLLLATCSDLFFAVREKHTTITKSSNLLMDSIICIFWYTDILSCRFKRSII